MTHDRPLLALGVIVIYGVGVIVEASVVQGKTYVTQQKYRLPFHVVQFVVGVGKGESEMLHAP